MRERRTEGNTTCPFCFSTDVGAPEGQEDSIRYTRHGLVACRACGAEVTSSNPVSDSFWWMSRRDITRARQAFQDAIDDAENAPFRDDGW